nr:GDP-fucose protein domain protein [Cedratvirus plubellavi]
MKGSVRSLQKTDPVDENRGKEALFITDENKVITDENKVITDENKVITDENKVITDENKGKECSFTGDENWISYLLAHADLREAGLLTKSSALDHYQRFGKQEGRSFDLLPKKEGVVVFSLSHGNCGLMNQLIALAAGMYMAHVLGRDFVCEGFYPQYDDRTRILSLEEILDVEATTSGLRTRMVKVQAEFPVLQTINLGCLLQNRKVFYSSLKTLYDADWPALHIGCPFFYNLDEKDDLVLDVLSLVSRFVFAKTYLDIALSYRPDVDYISVHVRLEDDMLAFLKSLGFSPIQHISKFRKILSSLPKEVPIFVASNLNKEKNTCSFVLQELEKTHKVFYSKSLGQGREIDALVDYLICLGGVSFIGSDQISTFSRIIFCSKTGTKV